MFGKGDSKRDYTFVSDIVSGFIAALQKDFPFEIINLGNSEPTQLKDFISIIEGVVGKNAVIKELPEQQGDVPLTYADVSKAQKLLGYKPKVRIKSGMEQFWEWYNQ